MKNKLIKDINEETWRKFVAYCKIKNIKVGEELNNVLKDHIKKNLDNLLR
jgi:hypothetical protein